MYAQSNQFNYQYKDRPEDNEKLSSQEDLILREESPIISLVDDIIYTAVEQGASDIHIESSEDEVIIRYRIDGILDVNRKLAKKTSLPLISRIKLMGQMDIAERRLPQDGRAQIKSDKGKVDLRISSLATIFGEKILIRILDNKKELLDLDKLGFSKKGLASFKEIINCPFGLILLCGPTGSGKSSTLYAALNYIASSHKNIITIEDPVECVLKGINQVQCNEKAGLDFSTALKSIVRQDPDVIMIGEIRDTKTAQIAVRSSSTGHLVLSTLHTNSSTSALNRLVDMGIEPFLVTSSVRAVVSQRLVRKICPNCQESYKPLQSSSELAFLGEEYTDKVVTLFKGSGCSKCNYTGHRGRVAIQEIFKVSAAERKLVLERADDETIKNSALKNNLITMKQDGIAKALAGITSLDEIIRITSRDEV